MPRSSRRWSGWRREKGVTAAQLALAWVLHQGDFIVPIPGARKIHHLEQNAAAADIELSAAEVAAIGDALSPDKVAGKRYTEASLALVKLRSSALCWPTPPRGESRLASRTDVETCGEVKRLTKPSSRSAAVDLSTSGEACTLPSAPP